MPPQVRLPTPAKRAVTNPTPNIPTPKKSFPDACEVRRLQPRRTSEAPSRVRSAAPRRAGSANTDPLIGQRVRHAKYGSGTITGVEGEGEDRKFTVRFSDHGTKKLVERYANLSWA